MISAVSEDVGISVDVTTVGVVSSVSEDVGISVDVSAVVIASLVVSADIIFDSMNNCVIQQTYSFSSF